MLRFADHRQIYSVATEDVFKISLGRGFFICGHDTVKDRSFCFWSKDSLSATELRGVLEDCFKIIQDSPSLTLKFVADSANHAEIRSILRELFDCEIKAIRRADVVDVLYFYGKDGRLRIERASVPVLASVSPAPRKVKVLIVDDSVTIHKLLKSIFKNSSEIEVVGAVADPCDVEEALVRLRPDVLTVDIHMDGMNGVQLLRKILPRFPIPSLLVTSLSLKESRYVLDGLEAGAVDYIQKPTLENMELFAEDIIEKVKAAATAQVSLVAKTPLKISSSTMALRPNGLIVIGASTGGTEALASVLTRLPKQIPPIVIVQHIPAQFSKAFADRLDQICSFDVLEATAGLKVQSGHVYVAPGGRHLRLCRQAGHQGLVLDVSDGDAVNRHKPSVDVLFESVLQLGPPLDTVAVLLTGMGSDGARGLLALKKAGVRTLAQDQESCVVYGMPKVAHEMGAVDQMVSLNELPSVLVQNLRADRKSA